MKHLFTTRLLIYATILGIVVLATCVKYPVDTGTRDIREIESVWQYIKTYSIWQDKVVRDVFNPDTFANPDSVLSSLRDTLHTVYYTAYNSPAIKKTVAQITKTSSNSISTVYISSLSSSTALLTITQFYKDENDPSNNTLSDFKETLPYLLAFKNIVIDLRSNGGGDLEILDSIMAYFLPIKTPYILATYRKYNDSTRTAQTIIDEEWKTKSTPVNSLVDKRLAILVNKGSASASEIMAAGLKDGKKTIGSIDTVTLVGSQTFGKGMGQIIISRKYIHKRDLKITYLRIKRICKCVNADYHREGIVPDLQVKDPNYQIDSALIRLEPNLRLSKTSIISNSFISTSYNSEKTIIANPELEK